MRARRTLASQMMPVMAHGIICDRSYGRVCTVPVCVCVVCLRVATGLPLHSVRAPPHYTHTLALSNLGPSKLRSGQTGFWRLETGDWRLVTGRSDEALSCFSLRPRTSARTTGGWGLGTRTPEAGSLVRREGRTVQKDGEGALCAPKLEC